MIFLSSSTLIRIQAPSPTLFSQICYLTWWILVWNFQICLDLNYSDILCSLLFSIYQFLPWFGLFSELICRSPLCFGFIQGTAPTQLAAHGATAWFLLARSGAGPEPLYQDPCSMVPDRHHSKTSFFSFFAKKLSLFAFSPALLGLCVRIWCLWFEILWLKIGLIGKIKR